MNTENIIIKCVDNENYTYYGIFSRGFAFDIEIIGCDFLVSFYDIVEGQKSQKIYDILIDFDMDDMHDYIEFLGDGDDFIPKMALFVQSWLEKSITEQMSEGKRMIDLSDSIRALMEDMTNKAYAHLEVIRSQDKENSLYDNHNNDEV